MKRTKFLSVIAILAVCTLTATAQDKGKGKGKGKTGTAPPIPGLTLTSPDFKDCGIIPDPYTQAGSNPLSPKLEWHQRPGRHGNLHADFARSRCRHSKEDRRRAALDGVQYSR